MSHNHRGMESHGMTDPDACDMLTHALKQMDHLLADTSLTSDHSNGHSPHMGNHLPNGQSPINNIHLHNASHGAKVVMPSRHSQVNKAVSLCTDLHITLNAIEDKTSVLQQLPAEMGAFLQQCFSQIEKDEEQSDGGPPRVTENMKLDLVVENSRLRLRLGKMERELQSLEDKFCAAQRRISDLHSCLNERTVEVTGLTSRLARTTHTSPERGQRELEQLKRVVELLKIADDEKNVRIEELKRTLNKYKKMEEVLVQLKKSQILETLAIPLDGEVEWRYSEDEESVNNRLIEFHNNNAPPDSGSLFTDDSLQDPVAHLRSSSAPRLTTATHQTLVISSSLPLSSFKNFADSCSSYDNLASYAARNLPPVKKPEAGSHETVTSDSNLTESPRNSPAEKRPPLPPHSTGTHGQGSNTQRRQNRAFVSLGKGILKSQGDRWSRSTPSLVPTSTSVPVKVEEVSERKEEGQKDKETQESRSPIPAKSQKKKNQPTGLKKLFGRMKRSSSQELDDKLEDFKRSPLRSTVGARLGVSDDIYDSNLPFARWDTDRVALWLHVLGLSMYIGNCRRWVKNGEQLLKATNRDLEKELEIHNRFHRKKLQLALKAVTSETRSPAGDLDHNWVARWLDDIGLPQYKDQFYDARIDGRLLHHLTVDELVLLKVTNAFHHLSFRRAIQVLRMNNFNHSCLIRRPSSDEAPRNCPSEVMLWTNHRIMEWLRSIDLSEYAPNLRGSGVHGALMVLEPRFGADVFATILSIPSSKTLLRRHLSTHFVSLVGNMVQQQKRDLESQPGYTALAPNQKVKIRRGIFKSEKPEEFICPMDISVG